MMMGLLLHSTNDTNGISHDGSLSPIAKKPSEEPDSRTKLLPEGTGRRGIDMLYLDSEANLLLGECDATCPTKVPWGSKGVGRQHVRLHSMAKAGIQSRGFDTGSAIPGNLQIRLNSLRSKPVRRPVILRQPRSNGRQKLGGADNIFSDIWLESKVDDESHRDNVRLETIVLREKPNVWGQVPITDDKVEHATTILASMRASKGNVESGDYPAKVPAPATLSNDISRVVEIANDDTWELGGTNEGNDILDSLLIGTILGTKVAVQVQGDDVQGPSFEPDLCSSVSNGRRRLMMAMHNERRSEEQHLTPTVVVFSGIGHFCLLLFALFSGSSGRVVQAKILLHFGHSWRSQRLPAKVPQPSSSSTKVRTHEMALGESPRIWLVGFEDAVQEVQHLLAEDCEVGEVKDESTRMPAVGTGVATLVADLQMLLHHQLLAQQCQSGSWPLDCPRIQ